MDNDTVIVVGVTREDEYGNLMVTPKGGGEEIRIGSKRSQLHPLFQQGVAVMLHWETYKGRPYVADAKLVEGELPPPTAPDKILPEHQEEIKKALAPQIAPQERGMCLKEVGECIRSGQLDKDFPKSVVKIKSEYYKLISKGSGIEFKQVEQAVEKPIALKEETL